MVFWPVTITQSVTPSEYRSERMSTPTPPNCSGLANSGVPTNAPGDEIPASEADSSSVFARPRSIIFAVTLAPSFTLTMMLVGLMSRWTRFCSCTAAKPAADLRRDFERQLHLQPTGTFDELLERFALYELHRVEVTAPSSAQVEVPRQHSDDERSPPRGLRVENEAAPIHHRGIVR